MTQQELMRILIGATHHSPVLTFTISHTHPLRWGAWYALEDLSPSPYRTFLYWLGNRVWPEYDEVCWN
jgi:hypothetical protein